MPASDPTDKFMVVDGLRLHYLERGDARGRPLILLHGLSSHAHAWDDLAAALAPYFWTLALDQRGHGQSAWADRYDAEAYVADLEGFADALGLESMALVGHSLGGRHAIIFAARHHQQVERLAIVDFGPEVMAEGVARMRQAAQTVPEAFADPEEAVALMVAESPNVDPAAIRRRTLHNLRRLPDGRWAWRFDPVLRQVGGGASPNLWPLLAHIPCPVLVVRGEESDLLAPEVAAAMAQALPLGQLVTVAGAGHRVPLEQPAAFARALLGFLGR